MYNVTVTLLDGSKHKYQLVADNMADAGRIVERRLNGVTVSGFEVTPITVQISDAKRIVDKQLKGYSYVPQAL